MAISLYPHQTRALRDMHNGTILTGGVGVGKSITALAYFYINVCEGMPRMPAVEFKPMAKPRPLYIITTAKKRKTMEWDDDAAHFGLGTEPDPLGVFIRVDSWNNIDKYRDVEGAFFIFDEQRVVGSGAWTKAFHEIAKKNLWIVLSATPGDVWMDYVPIFVANGFYRNRSEFIKRHVVYSRYSKFPKVERYLETAHLERLRKKILVDMPFERHTLRKIEHIFVEFDNELLERAIKDRWHIYEERPLKNVAELFLLMRKIVNSDLDRLGAVMKLLEKHPRLIVFYNFTYELDILRTLSKTLNYPIGEWNGQKHQDIPAGEKWLYLVQYTAGAEGWNCITTNAIAFYSLTYSYKAFEQAQGRIDRINTPYNELFYYVFRSKSKIDQAIWKSLLVKKDFNAKAYTTKLWDDYKPTLH